MNAISAIRRAEDLGMPFAKDLWMWPIPGGPRGQARPRAVHERPLDLEVREEQGRGREVHRRPLHRLEGGRPSHRTCSTSRASPGPYPLKQIYETAAADAHLPHGKYSILTTIASKYTRNVGYPGYSNAAVARGARHVSHSTDVRPGLPGQDERRRVGRRDRQGDEAHLGQVARSWKDLARSASRRGGFCKGIEVAERPYQRACL